MGAVDSLFSFFDVTLESVTVYDVLADVLGEGEPVAESVHDFVLFVLDLEELVSESALWELVLFVFPHRRNILDIVY